MSTTAAPYADVTEILDEHKDGLDKEQRVYLFGYVKAFYEMRLLEQSEMCELVARIGLDAQTADKLIL